jgi:hypothetical protein
MNLRRINVIFFADAQMTSRAQDRDRPEVPEQPVGAGMPGGMPDMM